MHNSLPSTTDFCVQWGRPRMLPWPTTAPVRWGIQNANRGGSCIMSLSHCVLPPLPQIDHQLIASSYNYLVLLSRPHKTRLETVSHIMFCVLMLWLYKPKMHHILFSSCRSILLNKKHFYSNRSRGAHIDNATIKGLHGQDRRRVFYSQVRAQIHRDQMGEGKKAL